MKLTLQAHWRKPLAAVVIGLLLAVLAVREGLQRWQLFGQWRALAESAAALQGRVGLSIEQLQQGAEARHIHLDALQPEQGGWQLRGQVADAQLFHSWLQSLQHDGAQPLAWGLEQAEGGLRFDLRVQP